MNSFFTDFSSEMIKPVLPLFMVLIWAPALLITLLFNISEFLSNIFKILFWYMVDKTGWHKQKMMTWYLISNFLKPLIWVFPWLYSIFAIEILNKIWKWIRTAPKEVIMKNSIPEDKMGLWFWFQKAMDSLWAFVWTIVATIILVVFWYTINVIENMFILTIIPGIISAFIIYYYIDFKDSDISIQEKEKKIFSIWDYPKIGGLFSSFMVTTILTSIANVWIIFYMLSLMKFQIPYYWITWMYALYMLTDSVLWFYLWKLSDHKNLLIKNVYIWYWALFVSIILMILMSLQTESNSSIIYILWIGAFISYGIFESVFDTWFKKLLSLNTNKEFSWTVLGSYSWIWGLVKIAIGIPLAIVFTNGGGLIVYSLCWIALVFSLLYFTMQIFPKAKTE